MNQNFKEFLQENGAENTQIDIIAVLIYSVEYRCTFRRELRKLQGTYSDTQLIDKTLKVVITLAKQRFVELYEGNDSIHIFNLDYLKDMCYMWLYDMDIPLELIKGAENFCRDNYIYYYFAEALFNNKGDKKVLSLKETKKIFAEFNTKYGKKKDGLTPTQNTLLGLLNRAGVTDPEKISVLAMANTNEAADEFIGRLLDALLKNKYPFTDRLLDQICADMYLFSQNVNHDSCPKLFYPEEYALSLRGPLKNGERLYAEKHNEENPKLRDVISIIKDIEGKKPTKLN